MNARPTGTRGMIAPELLPGLDRLPPLEMSDEFLAMVRSGAGSEFAMQPPPLSPEQASVSCEEKLIPGLNGAPDVRVLVYTPPGNETARPGYLHMHGGGYILGAPEISDLGNRSLAAAVGCVIVSVDYRLAPETRFPGSLEDNYAALKWLHEEAEALGVDRTRIAIGGESAGGGHAAALAIHARDKGEVSLVLQLLDSPMIDDRSGVTSDPHPYCGEFVWTPNNNRYGWKALLGAEPGGSDTPYGAAPARVEDLTGLAPAFISVGALDLFLEEDMEYARRLVRAGVQTELHVIPGGYHGFGAAGGDAPQIQTVGRLRTAALSRAFGQA
jgi:triacylglycerol lipase